MPLPSGRSVSSAFHRRQGFVTKYFLAIGSIQSGWLAVFFVLLVSPSVQLALTATTEAMPDKDSGAIPYRDAYIASHRSARESLAARVDEKSLYKPLTGILTPRHGDFTVTRVRGLVRGALRACPTS